MSSFRFALPALVLPLLVALPAAAAEDELCLGQVPTVVGAAQEEVVGTEGDDVIVAHDSATVRSLGGDDLICVEGTISRVDAGAGADQVDAVGARYGAVVQLGAGADTFLGGPRNDSVTTGDRADQLAGSPLGVDTVRTGAGNDRVRTGPGRTISTRNDDVIDLGGARDTVTVYGTWVPSIDGGGGNDELRISSPIGGDWVFDQGSDAVSIDDAAMGPIRSMSDFELGRLTWDHLTFRGGNGHEELTLGNRSGRVTDDGPVDINMGRDYDRVLAARSQDVGSIDGGAGFDSISINADRTTTRGTALLLDLQRDLLRLGDGEPLELRSWSRVYVDEADRSTFIGDGDPNRLTVFGCGNTIRGNGGDDTLTAFPGDGACEDFPRTRRGVHIDGGTGDDSLYGTFLRDRLVGGPGRDVVNGAGGGDVCQAEVRKYCGG